ncbi:hypothetical protein [Pseudomonas sp. Marseille-Q5115]|uniref:hypothetical protein n=1 Tax=Pseudomonas sp. Marseille-Q5115 TaxID=2866593 RepID=UPI001CE4801E|nr:hypothetical protein [Pseudomonas sp. Marseille-Q5115]
MTEQKLLPFEPTEAMLLAARDWSVKKYGQGVGNDGAKGCWQAMYEATQKVGAVGLPEPVAVVDDSDEGMFIDFIYGEDGNPLRRGDHLVSLEAVEQLVAGLRAEVERLIEDRARFPDKPDDIGVMIGAHIANLKKRAESAEDSLRWRYRDIESLRTQNAELVGLLRECSEDLPWLAIAADGHRTWEGMVADKDPTVDLCSRIDAALSAYEGREGE